MTLDTQEQESLRLYLLGTVPQSSLEKIEERLMTDTAFYDELVIAEDELIDSYLDGDLSPAERQAFERHFMIPLERQQKVRFARSLRKYISQTDPGSVASPAIEPPHIRPVDPKPEPRVVFPFGRNPILSYALAASVVAALMATSWITWRALRNPTQQLEHPLVVSLSPGTFRDGGNQARINVPRDKDGLRFELEVPPDDLPSVKAELQNDRGQLIFSSDETIETVGDRRVVSIDVPIQVLPAGDFKWRLSGTDSQGQARSYNYSFALIK